MWFILAFPLTSYFPDASGNVEGDGGCEGGLKSSFKTH